MDKKVFARETALYMLLLVAVLVCASKDTVPKNVAILAKPPDYICHKL